MKKEIKQMKVSARNVDLTFFENMLKWNLLVGIIIVISLVCWCGKICRMEGNSVIYSLDFSPKEDERKLFERIIIKNWKH